MRAIDVHVHPSTAEYVHDALGAFGPACEAYFRTTLPNHDVDQMAAVFRDADVLGVLFAWDAETNTGLPPVTNDFIAMLKDSSLVSVITVVELTKAYTIYAASTFSYLELGVMTALLYLAMSLPLARLARHMEGRVRYAE